MKSIDEIVNVCNIQTHEYYPINFTNLNLYMRLTNINDINKESLENFFGNNLYKRNETQEYLTHVLSRHAFREGLTIEKATKLYEIILNKEDVIINEHALDKSIYKRYKEMATCLNQLTKDSLQIDSDSLEKLGLIYGDKLFEFLQNDFQQPKSNNIKKETEAYSLKLKLIKKQIENIKENTL